MERDFLTELGLEESIASRILEEHGRDMQKVEAALAELRGALEQREYDDAVQSAVRKMGLRFSSKAAEKAFFSSLKENAPRLKDGVPEGLENFVQAWKTEDPDAFASERPAPRILAPAGLGTAPDRPAPFNVAQAREMGAERAAARKTSSDVLKYFL